jgi:hypothetical protein
MGAIAWAVLEMFRRGGMEPSRVNAIHEEMTKYFAIPGNDDCNAILKVVEERLRSDKTGGDDWY